MAMNVPVVVTAFVGALIAAAFAAQLMQQYAARRRHHALAWAVAVGLYALGMVALAAGLTLGWSPLAFGVYWLAGALLAVAFLAVGQLHLSDPRRAALWWTLGGLAVVWTGAALLLTPYDGTALASASGQGEIPLGADVFGSDGLAYRILTPITMGGTLVVLLGCLWSGLRTRRFGVLLIALGVFVSATSSAFVRAGYDVLVPIVLTLGIAIMYGGFRAAGKRPRPTSRAARAEQGAQAGE
jgi:hypothetical protein